MWRNAVNYSFFHDSLSPISGACGLSHSVVCNLTDEHVMKFLGCNSQLKRVQTSGRSVLEATYCKQCVRINEPNLGSFAGIHSLLLTPIHTELKAVSVMEINNMNNQILAWLIFKNTFSFWLFCANERKAVCFYCTHLGLWLVDLRI